jgi:hypothetical protein
MKAKRPKLSLFKFDFFVLRLCRRNAMKVWIWLACAFSLLCDALGEHDPSTATVWLDNTNFDSTVRESKPWLVAFVTNR